VTSYPADVASIDNRHPPHTSQITRSDAFRLALHVTGSEPVVFRLCRRSKRHVLRQAEEGAVAMLF
jgi:hypothetical protein